MLFDLRFAFRQISKNRGFAAIVVLTLGLAIGANTAIFSMVDSVLLKPVPYPNPEQLVWVFEMVPDGGYNNVSGGAFKDWTAHSSKFSHLAVFEETEQNLTGDGLPERVAGLRVSSEFLPALGVMPQLGSGFADGDDTVSGYRPVLVLSQDLWQRRFGGDDGVLGQIVSLDQVAYTVVGVLPAGALLQDQAQFLVPIVVDDVPARWTRSGHWRSVVGRLLPGASVGEAQAELRGIKQQLAGEYPAFKQEWSVGVLPLRAPFAMQTRSTMAILLGTVILVLLIACANVSSLMLARGTARAREMATRVALGAGAWRIARQILIESVVLALCGCGLGLLLASYGIDLLDGLVGGILPQALQPKLNLSVLGFSIVVACGCGLLFGLLPALRASRGDVNDGLKETERGASSGSKRRAQSILVMGEIALTLVLLIVAGLFLRSFAKLLHTDPGFDAAHTLAFDLSFPEAKYPQDADRMRFLDELSQRIAALPGVESVGTASSLPLSNGGSTELLDRLDTPEDEESLVGCDFVSGDFFSTMGIQLERGRAITDDDNRTGSPRVLVVDEGVARVLFRGDDPIGKSVDLLGETWQIVGVVSSVRHGNLFMDPRPRVYGPQVYSSASTSVVLRTALPPSTMSEMVREAVLAVDAEQPIANVRSLAQAVDASLDRPRATLTLLGLFALVALSLACIGIYGVISYTISQRTREMCIRAALGARRFDIVQLILRGGMQLTLVGMVLGTAGALLSARLVESQLFEVQARDPLVFLVAVLLLAVTAAISVCLPARRVARIDPVHALRDE